MLLPPVLLLTFLNCFTFTLQSENFSTHTHSLAQLSLFKSEFTCPSNNYQHSQCDTESNPTIPPQPFTFPQREIKRNIQDFGADLGYSPIQSTILYILQQEIMGFPLIFCILAAASLTSIMKTVYTWVIKREVYEEGERSIYDTNLFTTQAGCEDVNLEESKKFPVNIFILDNARQSYKNIPKNAILIYA